MLSLPVTHITALRFLSYSSICFRPTDLFLHVGVGRKAIPALLCVFFFLLWVSPVFSAWLLLMFVESIQSFVMYVLQR